MNRRAYLALGGIVAASTAGCAGVSGRTPLKGDEAIDERSAILTFEADDEVVLKIQLVKQYSPGESREHYPFYVATWQPSDVLLESLELRFQSSQSGGFSPAGISLREGAHAHYATLSQHDLHPSRTILALPDTAAIGGGSVKVNLLFDGQARDAPSSLWVRADANLTSSGFLGTDYRAVDDMSVEFP